MKMKTTTFLSALAALLCTGLPAFADLNPEDLSGQYQCDGGSYTGTVTIRKNGDAYEIRWQFPVGSHLGIGLREGDVLASTYSGGGGVAGVVVYRIAKDKLVGKYTHPTEAGRVLVETLTPTGEPAQPEGVLSKGVRVAAKWKDGNYWGATITGAAGARFQVTYDDGDHGVLDAAEMIPITKLEIAVGTHVLACWKGARMFPGVVTGQRGGLYTIQWDDGDAPLEVAADKVAPLPARAR
ncbi:MAG: hypothetical protein QOE70_3728 [Chthoniobacter sp.]|nr:hypothetical protein [Chthoniobacter sp.]